MRVRRVLTHKRRTLRPHTPEIDYVFRPFCTFLIGFGIIGFPVDAAPIEFDRDVRPIFARHCWKCHGPDKQQGGLRLDARESVFQGGDSAEPAVVPFKASESRLLALVTSSDKQERMPPDSEPLSDGEIEKLRRWIDGGAVWPLSDSPVVATSRELMITEEDRRHWSFQPLQPVAPPPVEHPDWARTPVDRFVLHAIETRGLAPNPPADARTLVRRAFFDLIGLPPQWTESAGKWKEEVLGLEVGGSLDQFTAPESLLASLLKSPHYGERWARHWLDVARYADSNGQEGDADRPNAYRFRDFVIRALNDDLPFDQFVRWQLAGDEYAPDNPDAIAATGFLVAGHSTMLMVPMEEEKLRNRANELDDMVATTGQALLGLTLGCCRCHDHKYDPLSTRDYYRMTRAFNSGDRRDVPLGPPAEVRKYTRAMAEWQAEYDPLVKQRDDWLKEARRPVAEPLRSEKIRKLKLSDDDKQLLIDRPNDGEAKKLANRFKKELSITDAEYVAALPAAEQAKWRTLDAAVEAVAARQPAPLPMAFAFGDFSAEPRETWFFERGDFLARNEQMDLGFLSVLMRDKSAEEYWQAAREARRRDDSTQQRQAMAEWITDLEHGAGPLLARVMANRVWQHHFGEGLVRTPNDFGTRGERPTHPELLEWLAGELVRSGWSVKHLHGLIVHSATYQQSSAFDEAKAATDPDNRLLWRFPPRRLEAELLRDAMLTAAGTLNKQMYGPGFKPPIAIEAMQARNVKNPYPGDVQDTPASCRRTIYMFHKRVVQYPLLQAFDAPDGQVSCGRRFNTTVAPQALALLNDPFVRLRAAELARRAAAEGGGDVAGQVRRAWVLALAREPSAQELAELTTFVAEQESARQQRGEETAAATAAALTDLCQTLFGLNEFIYID
ncbi:MAG: PSD1 and planctomycete cytochrome C domain-containing protein [Pirellulaceae bacterium]